MRMCQISQSAPSLPVVTRPISSSTSAQWTKRIGKSQTSTRVVDVALPDRGPGASNGFSFTRVLVTDHSTGLQTAQWFATARGSMQLHARLHASAQEPPDRVQHHGDRSEQR